MRYEGDPAGPPWGPHPHRHHGRRPPAAVLAVQVGLVQILFTWLAAQGHAGGGMLLATGRRPFDLLALSLLLAESVALLPRRRAPLLSFMAITFLTVAYLVLGCPYGPVFLAFLVALGPALTPRRRVRVWVITVTGFAAYVLLASTVGWTPHPSPDHYVVVATWMVIAFVLIEFVRGRRRWAMEAQITRREESRRRATEERMRIARDLHDVLAHNISLINVQASSALHLIDSRPEQARTALTAIKAASKDALTELRSVLAVLRQEGDVPTAPAPGLADVPALVEQAHVGDLAVALDVSGERPHLPPGVDVAAYRIVQEALTNVRRHSDAHHARVVVTYGDNMVRLVIEDDGRGGDPAGDTSGSGIEGMRERARALGGELHAGPRDDTPGFRVTATLPLGSER